MGGKCRRDLHETQFAINVIANAPSILGPFVHIETGKRYADGAEELVNTQEVAMQSGEDDFRGISLRRDQQLAFLMPFHVLGSLLLHRGLVLFLAECDCHEAVVGFCTRTFTIRRVVSRRGRGSVSAGSEVGRLMRCV